MELKKGEGIAGWVAEHKQTIVMVEITSDTRPDFTVAQYFLSDKMRTLDEDEILPLGAGESNCSDN